MVTAARRTAITALTLLATLAGASAAQAADVQISTNRFVDSVQFSSYVTFRAAPGERNDVTVTREGRTFVVTDAGAPLRSPDGSCEISADARSARCFVPERLTVVDVELRDGDDRGANDLAAEARTASTILTTTTFWTAARETTCSRDPVWAMPSGAGRGTTG